MSDHEVMDMRDFIPKSQQESEPDKRPIPIMEEMGVHKQWYEEARQQTKETLPAFIRHLTDDYLHDYGTVCHAIAAAMYATGDVLAKEEGITGFQAGAVMWQLIYRWGFENNKCGLKILDYDDMLYPQSANKWARTISPDTMAKLQAEATRLLQETPGDVHPAVKFHWEMLAQGQPPFGFTVEKETE